MCDWFVNQFKGKLLQCDKLLMNLVMCKFGSLVLRESIKLNSIRFQWYTFDILRIAHPQGFN